MQSERGSGKQGAPGGEKGTHKTPTATAQQLQQWKEQAIERERTRAARKAAASLIQCSVRRWRARRAANPPRPAPRSRSNTTQARPAAFQRSPPPPESTRQPAHKDRSPSHKDRSLSLSPIVPARAPSADRAIPQLHAARRADPADAAAACPQQPHRGGYSSPPRGGTASAISTNRGGRDSREVLPH